MLNSSSRKAQHQGSQAQEQTVVTSPVTQQPSVTQAVPQTQSASPYDNVDEDATRGNDVSSLVRRFSGSDYDNKERSPTPKRTSWRQYIDESGDIGSQVCEDA